MIEHMTPGDTLTAFKSADQEVTYVDPSDTHPGYYRQGTLSKYGTESVYDFFEYGMSGNSFAEVKCNGVDAFYAITVYLAYDKG